MTASKARGLLPMPSMRRSLHMVQRNLAVYKRTWMVVVSGFFEPLFYLLSIGLGLGAMVPDIDGLNYGAFVAPGLLAASCMNGAISDGFFNIFFKLHYKKTYEGILATPMGAADVAFGEMLWALMRGSLYAAAFLVVVFLVGAVGHVPMILSPWALLAWPAAVLVAGAFAAIALLITTLARKIQDFDIVMGLVILPMFLFSGTFFPISPFHEVIRWMIRMVPMYHAVALLRQLTTGAVGPSILVHIGYLVLVGGVALMTAIRRLERALVT